MGDPLRCFELGGQHEQFAQQAQRGGVTDAGDAAQARQRGCEQGLALRQRERGGMQRFEPLLQVADGWTTTQRGTRRTEIDGWVYDWEAPGHRLANLWRWPAARHNDYDIEIFIIATKDAGAAILHGIHTGKHLPQIEINMANLKRIKTISDPE